MTDPIDDEENYPARPRWIGWLIGLVILAAVLGVANIGWRIMRVSSAEQAADALVQSQPELAAGKKLVEQSDCMRCHGWDRKFVGPAFASIADKYRERSDAQAYLAGKIRSGSVGVWGNVIMPRHPQISEADSLQMARWVMSAKASANTAEK
ncbi:MAG: c-type cytochrome [Comamonas sp.]|jgi:cytochrome c551/c552|nr:c-type cytochrome [Comamonas sp.]